jgi:hypothetical protein
MSGNFSAAAITAMAIFPPSLVALAIMAARLGRRQVLLHRRVSSLVGPGRPERAIWLRATY